MESFKNTKNNSQNESLGKSEKEEDFEFLTEEELSSLSDDELALYYKRLEKKGESDQAEYHSKAPEIDPKKHDEKWEKKLEKLYKSDPNEPYWNK